MTPSDACAASNAPVQCDAVIRGEAASINARRKKQGRDDIKACPGFGARPADTENEIPDTVGLALSGGGVRSAAFCLGALQSLHLSAALDRIDYLSTVSGGGYIGASLSGAMTVSGGEFPFSNELAKGEAPGVLGGLPPPDAIFVGGGATADGLLDAAWTALPPRGRLVVNAVTIETQAELTRRFTAQGGDLVSINIARADPIGGFHGWRPAMPVVQWSVVKP